MQQDGSLSVSNTGAKTPGIPGLTALLELVPLVLNEFMAVFCKMQVKKGSSDHGIFVV